MPTEQDSLSAKVHSSFQELSKVATDLNSVSDSLGQCIADLDASLKKLNLGLTKWIKINESPNFFTEACETQYLGYAKVSGRWGIALSEVVTGPDASPIADQEWAFNEAPRELRLAAVEKIPELLDELSKAGTEMIADAKAKVRVAFRVAEAIKSAANPPKSPVSATAPPVPSGSILNVAKNLAALPKPTGGQK